MLVTGGLGGLGLVASYHCAVEWENPIITTSRSARLPPSAGPTGMNIYESIEEKVPLYNAKLDVSNSKALCDFMVWINRPGVPPEDKSLMMDELLNNLRTRMHNLPNDALRMIQEFLFEVKDKIREIMSDLTARETKVDPAIYRELQEKEAKVTELIDRLKEKVGSVSRSGRCTLMGGAPLGFYRVPDAQEPTAAAETAEKPQVTQETLLEVMREEMEKQMPGCTKPDFAGLSKGALPPSMRADESSGGQ